MSGRGFSGVGGDVKVGGSAVAEVASWSFEPKVAVPKYVSNATAGYKAAVAGAKDGSGKVEVVLPSDGNVPWGIGDSVTLVLHLDASGSNYLSVPAIIESAPIEVKLDGESIVSITYAFQSNGAWTEAGIMSATPSSSPGP